MTTRVITTVLLWLAIFYGAQAASLAFDGEASSGGETKGHAQDISCKRNPWAFGLLWSCDATIVANDGKRYAYHRDNSILTPADVGRQVPMTTNSVRSGRSSQASTEWGLAERREPNTAAAVLCAIGLLIVGVIITFRLFRKKAVS
ncbi:hypothetical protein BBK82_05810 [Lentzea guizhouensis]|uniref:Gram-positive cocci surface proteins LPxTG domain-containing protein n=1 Tax=Lentzea guizhouensis TaxID=1586287 RepID=A0A1B2HD53_9PSEU|nr:DUF6346 domain-containing protein [Lentzea guizhouensis]ANZ35667.1 hypothetical protein BBK82_05810 [Lentzea guizhouensis]